MDLGTADIYEASKLMCQLVEDITCIECSNYYRSPETAPCGHTLCHTCWYWKYKCPKCAVVVDKKKLHKNDTIQNFTVHICYLRNKMEKLFNMNLTELVAQVESDKNPTKSQNLFCAPSPSSQSPVPVILEARDLLTEENEHTIEIIPNTEVVNNNNEGTELTATMDSEVTTNKQNYKSSANKIYKKSLKLKNDWNNVKKMRIEYNKLKKNLNVAIEMCEKDNNLSKPTPIKNNHNIEIAATVDSQSNNNNDVEEDNRIEQSTNEVLNVDNINGEKDSVNVNLFDISSPSYCTINEEISEHGRNSSKYKTPFFRKSSLANNCYVTVASENTNNEDNTVNNTTSVSDNDSICIKIGTAMANIKVEKKQNHFQVKVYRDQESQTSLDQNLLKKNAVVQPPKITVHKGSSNNISTQTSAITKEITINEKIQQLENLLDKSVSTKKHTDSADTASVQFEITERESVEKEPSSIMECGMSNDAENVQPQQEAIIGERTDVDMCPTTQRTHYLNNSNIVEYGSVKEKISSEEPQVQLKHSKKVPSKTIISSVKSSKHKTLKVAKKRTLDNIATNHELPQAKKQKTCNTTKDMVKEIEQDNEPINCDIIMGQVFAKMNSYIEAIKQSQISNITLSIPKELIKEHCSSISSLANENFCTPMQEEDSDKSVVVVKETPQTLNANTNFAETRDKSSNSQMVKSITNLIYSVVESKDTGKDVTIIEAKTCETPLTINEIIYQIQHRSAPFARNPFVCNDFDPDQTLCPTSSSQITPHSQVTVRRPLAVSVRSEQNRKLCIAGSLLSEAEIAQIKELCKARSWTYTDENKELTHLVVNVDEENKAKRSVKYLYALAEGKWIVNYTWINKCLQSKKIANEEPYEALDVTGEPGPRRSRTGQKKVFEGISFFCMPPFTAPDCTTLTEILEAAGGTMLSSAEAARLTTDCPRPVLLLAEPKNKQKDAFTYLATELNIVPVNYMWALDCLGSYTLESIQEYLLCPSTLLPAATSQWPERLLM